MKKKLHQVEHWLNWGWLIVMIAGISYCDPLIAFCRHTWSFFILIWLLVISINTFQSTLETFRHDWQKNKRKGKNRHAKKRTARHH